MFITSNIQSEDEASATVLVKLQYFDKDSRGLLTPEEIKTFLVTIDKITEGMAVHCGGITKKTRMHFEDTSDRGEIEERAVLAAIHFPSE